MAETAPAQVSSRNEVDRQFNGAPQQPEDPHYDFFSGHGNPSRGRTLPEILRIGESWEKMESEADEIMVVLFPIEEEISIASARRIKDDSQAVLNFRRGLDLFLGYVGLEFDPPSLDDIPSRMKKNANWKARKAACWAARYRKGVPNPLWRHISRVLRSLSVLQLFEERSVLYSALQNLWIRCELPETLAETMKLWRAQAGLSCDTNHQLPRRIDFDQTRQASVQKLRHGTPCVQLCIVS